MEENKNTMNPLKPSLRERLTALKASFLSKYPGLWGYHKMSPEHMSHHRASWMLISELSLLICILAGAFLLRSTSNIRSNVEYGQSYQLVSEKLSEHAPITINLPPGLSASDAAKGITFDPNIKGSWQSALTENEIIWKPSEPLKIGTYYSVDLTAAGTHLRDDFLVDEDPAVQAIFPSDKSEVNENSSVTIVFNRPMVPMTTLTELENKALPITLTPKTEGRWKWISTRNVQFIPKDRLFRSTKYTISIGSGLVSMDGLPVQEKTQTFVTRPIRYSNLSQGQMNFNRPISITFNQPVDIDRTIREISVTNVSKNSGVPFVAEYAVTKSYDRSLKKEVEFINRVVINIYPKEDRFGRARLWDFTTNYQLAIKKAYPLEGDIILNQPNGTAIQIPEIISSLSATSKRSGQVRLDLFDPEGSLVVHFYEEVDRASSKISAKALQKVEYGEKCAEDSDGNVAYLPTGECEKVTDKKVLVLSFDPKALALSENVPVVFEQIYTTSGLQINAEKITKNIRVYPKFAVSAISPANGEKSASLIQAVVCSNTPIKPVPKEEYKNSLSASGYLVFGGWENSYPVGIGNSFCKNGEFLTNIRYGLLPETKYSLTVRLEDEFSQKITKSVSFTTRKPESQYTRFYNMQKAYNVTTPGKTKLTYAVENLEYVHLHICKLSAEAFLKATINQPKNTDAPSVSACSSVKTDRIELPKRYWVNNYFQIDLSTYFTDTLGQYMVTFSNPLYREEYGDRRPIYDRTFVSVTRLAIGEKKVQWNADYYAGNREQYEGRKLSDTPLNPGQNLYWISRFNTLQPLAGAVVSNYTQEGTPNYSERNTNPIQKGTSIVTNAEGIAKGDVTQNIVGTIVSYGIDSAVITPWADQLQYAMSAQNAGKTYLYTDRPIYRPGQEVFLRGIDRVGYDGTYEVFRDKDVGVKVFDSKGNVLYDQKLPISLYGTFSSSVILKSDAPLGSYRIEAFGNSTWFDVEEYVGAAFKIESKSEKPEYIAGENMKVNVDAQYYFGVPVANSEVSYTVTSQDYYFDKYKDEYFNFGNGWYDCYSCGYGDRYVFRGKTQTDENGKASIEKKLDFSEFYKDESGDSSKIFVVDITVKDTSGRSVSSQQSFIVHRGQFYLGVKTDTYSTAKNKEFTIRGKSVDTEGKPLRVSNISLEINKITWETFKRREVDGGFYYRSEQKKTSVKKETIRTDGDGDWNGKYSLADEGEYEIQLASRDSLGNTVTTKTSMYVYGSGQADIRETNNNTLEIATEKLDVSVGDKAKIIIKSPFKKAKALITTERGKIFDYHIVDVDRSMFDYAIPIRAEYAPNIYVSVLLLSDGPEIKFGQVEFRVNADQYKLNINVTPDKTKYLPGEKVTLSVSTTDHLGKPVPAEVSLAVADLSVLALKGNPKKNPLVFFYNGFPLTVTTASNIKNILEEMDIPVGTKGGGGGDPADLATKKRGIFKDTAYWESSVVTDEKGKASVSFTLPDNLTTWQIESLGVTEDTKLGVDYKEIMAAKHLMVIPLKPRFIIPGDEFYIGAKIFNQTEKRERFSVTIDSATLELLDTEPKTISINTGKTDTVYFKVKAPTKMQDGVHTFVLSAKGAGNEDTVENTIPITRNDTYETVATANFTKTNLTTEYIYVPEGVVMDKGGLTINANATMAVFLGDSIKYLASYPYGCSEQLASKLSAIGIVRRGMNVKNVGDKVKLPNITFEGKSYTAEEAVKLGLNRLYNSQYSDGSFSYYPGIQSDYYLTLHVVRALENLRKAGFEVNTESLNRASNYLYSRITTDYKLNQDRDLVILTAYILNDIESLSGKKGDLQTLVLNAIKDKKYLNEDMSSMTLAYLAILTADKSYSRTTAALVMTTLENRIDIDGRGAYLKGNARNQIYRFYETRATDTGLLLKALVAQKIEHPLIDKIMRWLLRSRDKDGAWGSTNTTLAVIDGMTDYLNWQRETESDFLLTGNLDGKKVFGFDFNKNTILDTFTQFLPIDAFPQNKTVTLKFDRQNRNELKNNFYYDMSLKYFLPVDKIAPRDEGITITRELFKVADAENKTPVRNAKVGDVLRGKITITAPKDYNFVSIEDFIPAGFELVNFDLATEDQSLLKNDNSNIDNNNGRGGAYGLDYGATALLAVPNTTVESAGFFKRSWLGIKEFFLGTQETPIPATPENTVSGQTNLPNLDQVQKLTRTFYSDNKELHDDRLFLFKEHLSPGVYEYEYYIRALVPGTFHHLPARVEEMYLPEVFGRTAGEYFVVES